MQTFKCDNCKNTFPIVDREIIIDLKYNTDIEVCTTCHGDVYKFCNAIGGSTGNMKQQCEKCLARRVNDDLDNVDGELYCNVSDCAELRRGDLAAYYRDSQLVSWDEYKAERDNKRDRNERDENLELAICENLDIAESALVSFCNGMDCEPFDDCTICPIYEIRAAVRVKMEELNKKYK